MAYPAGHRARVREQILRSARRLFNRSGYDGTSIDDVMTDIGLTRGAFYFHFSSKAQLFREAVGFVLVDHPAKRWTDCADEQTPAQRLVHAYLSKRHLEELEESCPLVTHSAEAARGNSQLAGTYADVLRALVRTIDLGCSASVKHNDSAYAVACLCVGALSLARGVRDDELAVRLLEAARSAAYALAGWDERIKPATKARA